MHFQMICESRSCSYENRPYVLEIRSEAAMDERNMATMFCPYCKQALARKEIKTIGCR